MFNEIITYIPSSFRLDDSIEKDIMSWYKLLPYYKKIIINMFYKDCFTDILVKNIINNNYDIVKFMILELSINYKKRINCIENYPVYLILSSRNIELIKILYERLNFSLIENFNQIYQIICKKIKDEIDTNIIKWILQNIYINQETIEKIYKDACMISNYDLIKIHNEKISNKTILKNIIENIENHDVFKYILELNLGKLRANYINIIVIESCKKGLINNLKYMYENGVKLNSLYYDETEYPVKIIYTNWKISKKEIYIEIAKWLISIGIVPTTGDFFDLYIEKITVN